MRRLTEDKKGLETDKERNMKSSKEGKPSRENRPRTEYETRGTYREQIAVQFSPKLQNNLADKKTYLK